MRKGILIQARLSSSRFPGKMLKELGGVPLVQYVFNRCKMSSQADFIGVVTSIEQSDDCLYLYCVNNKIPVFRGSLNNVLDRYIQAAKHFKCDFVCRVCGDSPFVDIYYIDKLLRALVDNNDYLAVKGGFNGFLSEVVSLAILMKIQSLTSSPEDLEHVTKYIRNHLEMFDHQIFDMDLKVLDKKLQDITLTIDYEQDLELANLIVDKGLHGYDFLSEEAVAVLKRVL